jgi:two-component system, NarL family, response regulator NreC
VEVELEPGPQDGTFFQRSAALAHERASHSRDDAHPAAYNFLDACCSVCCVIRLVLGRAVIKVLLVDDMTLTRTGIKALLEGTGEVEVVGEAGNGHDAIHLAQKLQPDVVLMDVTLPKLNGIEATRQIRAILPDMRVLMLAYETTGQDVFESLRAGAAGFITKAATIDELLSALQTVVAGGTYLNSSLTDVAVKGYVQLARTNQQVSQIDKLSGREREVLQLLAEGHSSARIGRRLHISGRTVNTHRHNIMRKLDIHTVAGLTRFAVQQGLTSL